jgi:coenzyme Q-binding protein COQ10
MLAHSKILTTSSWKSYINQICQTRSVFNLSKAVKSLNSNDNESPAAQKYTITKKFPYPQLLIYQLISRVDLYHEFIPYCTSSFITSRDLKTNEPKIAGLRVGFQSFDEEFTCNLNCLKPELVNAKSITHSLFYFLETEWKITPIIDHEANNNNINNNSNHCIAELNLKYEFKSPLYNQVSSLFAKKVASLMTKAFERRAYEVYRDNEKFQQYENDKLI